MSNKEIRNTIKSTVHYFLPEARVLLFGSRANGKFHNGSDYDVLVVTEKTFAPRAKLNWQTKIHVALVDALELPFDIILNSEKEIAYKKDLPGHVVRNAMREAIEL